jgi:phthalate 4,5-cis-dihydrodiol dehydrogenase
MHTGQTGRVLRVGIVGIGGAAVNMLPAFDRNPSYKITAAADVDADILARFAADYGAETFTSVEAIAQSPNVDLLYIATPTTLHAAHVRAALNGGKHVLIEKPMAVSLEDADVMIADAARNRVLLGVNVKHSFEPRVQRLRDFVVSGELGRLRMINSWRYVDWLYKPRSQEELTPGWGSGLLWRQGPHQLDIVRTIAGGMIRSIRGTCQILDPARHVPGAYSAFIDFANDVSCTVVCSGYDHFDSRALVSGFDGRAPLVSPERYGRARRELNANKHDPDWEDRAAAGERYGGGREGMEAPQGVGGGNSVSSGWLLGGPLIASFERADVRLSRGGLVIDGDDGQQEIAVASDIDGRDGRLNSFYSAVVDGTPLPADGRWGKATQEALVALEQSSERRAEVALRHQTPTVDVTKPEQAEGLRRAAAS